MPRGQLRDLKAGLAQWALLISTHEQRHNLHIREVKADQRFPRK
jgi:hypothetical protein